jgi:hypothetical protein
MAGGSTASDGETGEGSVPPGLRPAGSRGGLVSRPPKALAASAVPAVPGKRRTAAAGVLGASASAHMDMESGGRVT